MVGSSSSSSIVLFSILAGLAGSALAKNCGKNEFYWSPKAVCLPKGGPGTTSEPPALTGCPDKWYWSSSLGSCAPKNANAADAVSCGNNYVWDVSAFACKPPKCGSNKFWYEYLGTCIVKGGPTNPPKPPVGSSCPAGWYWREGKGICAPKQPGFQSPPSCGTDVWSPSDQCCHAPPKPTCNGGEFYWGERNCCLPRGGPPRRPTPPPGRQCPGNWSWHSGKGCCVPHFPDPPKSPSCPGRWRWNPRPCACEPPSPEPSKRASPLKKKRVDTSECPKGMQACPIVGLFGGEYECLDTRLELQSCGGCVAKGEGQDCTAIPHARSVGCWHGSCIIYACKSGFSASVNSTACVPSTPAKSDL